MKPRRAVNPGEWSKTMNAIDKLKNVALELRKLVDWDDINCPNRVELRRIEKKIDGLYHRK